MVENRLLRLHPTLRMIGEEMKELGISCTLEGEENGANYRGARLFSRAAELTHDVIYVLRPGDHSDFPGDEYAFISIEWIPGEAEHLVCPGQTPEFLLEQLLELFFRLRQMEMEMDDLVFLESSLEKLCELGAQILENPICIHDDWFVMIAKSKELHIVLPPDYIMSSSKEFVPQVIVEDFKFDSDYLETYAYRTAQLWDSSPTAPPCLYVNLWAGTVYCGRVLIVRYRREFRPLDYLIAEVLTQRVMMILRRTLPGDDRPLRSMDDVVYELMTNGNTASMEVNRLMEMLGWSKQDKLLCIRTKNQRTEVTVTMDHLLHSDLFRAFPGSYILLTGHEQCVILNITLEPTGFIQLRHRLAPMCRDYCLYAGISSPVSGVRELHLAYYQAEVALNRAFQLQSERWIIPFSDCAVDYLLDHMDASLRRSNLVSPELMLLMEHDREKGTQYFETLRTFLIQERDIPKTSEVLIIHRTTLLYRLKKISALTDLDLDHPDVRLHLLLSLRILDRERI